MKKGYAIAGYARISVDDERDHQTNVSIENQKSIIADFVQNHFPGSSLTFFEDRDRSGYTFDQREAYQIMRRDLICHKYDILVIKDFSRFSRRNSRGLVELEDLRDAGVRIISIGEGIDFPNDDDWLKIQFQFLINEMPVTDTSKKVRNVIKRRQAEGKWLCAAPYGYILNARKEFEIVPTEAEVIRTIYRLYNQEGWGYKRIANHLTADGVPTPRMSEQMRKDREGIPNKLKVRTEWAAITIQGILDNDFYIGTLRQGKTTRAKINGKQKVIDENDQIVIEKHHQAIIDYRTFATTRALRDKRTRSNYRGVKKYANVYSGFMECGDCGSPMFSMSRGDLRPAYICGGYHRKGVAKCSSHHIRVDRLDELLKRYVKKVMDNSSSMISQLNADLLKEGEDVTETEQSADRLAEILDSLTEEMKVTRRQRIRDIMRKPDQEDSINDIYDELESDLQKRIDGINYQINQLSDKRNMIIQLNRVVKTALDVFDDILNKESLERNDLELIVDRIKVFENRIEIKLQQDIDTIINCGIPVEMDELQTSVDAPLTQSAPKQIDKVFAVNVVSEGEPSLATLTQRETFCLAMNKLARRCGWTS